MFEQLTQISGLKSQVQDLKLSIDPHSPNTITELRQLLEKERDALESKEKQVSCYCISELQNI